MLKKRVTEQQVIDLIGRQKEILSDFDEAVRNQSGVDSKKLENQIKKFETNSQFCELKNIKMENGKIMDLNIIIEGEKEMADLKAW